MREGGSRRVGGHQATPGLCAEVSARTCRPSGALSCRGSQHTQRRAPPPRGPGDMGTAGKECGLLSGAAAQGHPSARRAARAAWVPLCLFAPQGRVAGAPLGHDPTPCDASDSCHMRSLVTAVTSVVWGRARAGCECRDMPPLRVCGPRGGGQPGPTVAGGCHLPVPFRAGCLAGGARRVQSPC